MSAEPRFYSSTEMLVIVGSTRKTLRVLERHGLIRPARSTGVRRYSQECLRRFWLIVTLRGLGYSLKRIGGLLDADVGAVNAGEAATALTGSVDKVLRRIDGAMRDLEIARQAMLGARTTLAACSSCDREQAACIGCARNGRLDSISNVLLNKAGQRGLVVGGGDVGEPLPAAAAAGDD